MKLVLVGLGKWGKNIKKTLEELPDFAGGFVEAKEAEAVIVATPGSTHAEVALPFIKQGLPVFIEKPMTTSLRDALRLEKATRQHGGRASLVFVGHLHLYNPAFLKAKELVKKAGKIRYVSFEGMNWGPFRSDMSAMWDWAPHDIAMALELFGKSTSIQAWGEYDWATLKLETPSQVSPLVRGRSRRGQNFFITIHVSSLSSEKRKKMMVAGEKYSVIFDDTADQKVSIYERGQVSYPSYEKTMPLTAELTAFIQMIKTKKKPKTDIQNGVEVVRILDAAERSMKKNGKPVKL